MISMHSALRGLIFGALVPTISCAQQGTRQPPQQAQLARAVAPPARLEPPDYLPETARAVLRTMMSSHAQNMGSLMSAIMALDYPRIRAGADAIAGDARLSRPLTGDATELNSLLPEEFFRIQDGLREEAKVLAEAAQRQSPYAVSDAYGRVAQTCVRCHYIYRAGTANQPGHK